MVKIVKKVDKKHFENILLGKKKFEIRIENDCKFNEGDIIVLKEINNKKEFTGREIKKKIVHIERTKEYPYWKKEEINKLGFAILGFE